MTLAEVSVAFVGFGGVVGVFGISRGREAVSADRGRIRNLGEIGGAIGELVGGVAVIG